MAAAMREDDTPRRRFGSDPPRARMSGRGSPIVPNTDGHEGVEAYLRNGWIATQALNNDRISYVLAELRDVAQTLRAEPTPQHRDLAARLDRAYTTLRGARVQNERLLDELRRAVEPDEECTALAPCALSDAEPIYVDSLEVSTVSEDFTWTPVEAVRRAQSARVSPEPIRRSASARPSQAPERLRRAHSMPSATMHRVSYTLRKKLARK